MVKKDLKCSISLKAYKVDSNKEIFISTFLEKICLDMRYLTNRLTKNTFNV